MRILAIRGQNLASLQRPFEIRLDAAPLGGAGLFAIVGPVGAGKSTLLDALCLPLFDRTPRLSGRGGAAVGDGEDEKAWLSSNDPRTLLRRGAPEGFAEVEFVGRDGVRYRAQWRVRRARRRAEGRVQEQELQLADLDRNVVVASGRKTDVLAAIRERLGLDFAQFCRSVLLAQGDFAAFLHASARDRAQLLETLTGADVYRRLSVAAHERRRDAERRRDELSAQLQLQPGLTEEARQALHTQQAKLAAELAFAEKAVELAQNYVNWYRQAAQHAERESKAHVRLQAAQAQNAAAAAHRKQLAALQRALPVGSKVAIALDRRARHHKAMQARDAAVAAVAAATAAEEAARDALQNALGAWRSHSDAHGLPPVVREWPAWRALCEQWAAAAAASPAAVDIQAQRAELAAAEAELQARQQALAGEEFAAVVARQRALDELERGLRSATMTLEAWRKAAKAVVAAAARRDQAAARAVELAAGREARGAFVASADAEHSAAQAALEAARRGQLATELAEHLHDGRPCPVCGSAEHPAPATGEPALDAARSRVAAAQAAAAAAKEELARHDRDHALAEAAVRDAQERVAEATGQHDSAAREFAATGLSGEDLSSAATALEAAQQSLVPQRTELAAMIAARQAASDALAAAVAREKLAAAAVRVAEQGERLRAAAAAALQALEPGFDGVEQWRNVLQQRGAAALRELRSLADAATACAELQRQVGSRRDAAAQAERGVGEASTELAEAEGELQEGLRTAAVDLELVLFAQQQGAAGLAAEAARLEGLASAEASERAVLQQCLQQRREHEQGGRPTIEEADATNALDDARGARTRLREALQQVQSELGVDDQLRRHREEMRPKLAAREAELRTWMALDELIGSSDGSAFAVFAQSLTLDFLLFEANRRLEELARRYRLHKTQGGELDFVVVDLDLGGARRSLLSLSGGETFLVSLSLALALATLAAPKTRVETLFLDEGFGTLDAQSLEGALGALDSLQARGCQVGIISHVDGIAERIGAVVTVVPEGGGRSRVEVRGG